MDIKEFLIKVANGEIKNRKAFVDYFKEYTPEVGDPSKEYTRLTMEEIEAMTEADFLLLLEKIKILPAKIKDGAKVLGVIDVVEEGEVTKQPKGKKEAITLKPANMEDVKSFLQWLSNQVYDRIIGRADRKIFELPQDMAFNEFLKKYGLNGVAKKLSGFLRYDKIITDEGLAKKNNFGTLIEHIWQKHFEYRKDDLPSKYPKFCEMAQDQYSIHPYISKGHFYTNPYQGKIKDVKDGVTNEETRRKLVLRFERYGEEF